LADLRRLPVSITVDHGPKFEGLVLDAPVVPASAPLAISFVLPELLAKSAVGTWGFKVPYLIAGHKA